ncbi:MAG: ATP synthase subunit I [Desulfobacterales bacterium]|nr:ATP synthase subunit I [Desulfobacterales bacterium]
MEIEKRILRFVTLANWILFAITSLIGFTIAPVDFALGILFGGLIVTVNFHLLARTLKKALTPPHLASHVSVLKKYYIRFVASGVILFLLISQNIVNPLGLFIGLSVVVASIMTATALELTKIIFKEAV